MFFSIIVPVYNVEKYIKQCIESILSQDYDDYELILVDDGTKDSSGFICDEYAKIHNNVTVIHKENGGLSSARNAGLEAAKGEWIWFIDSDDYIEAHSLSKLAGIIKKEQADMYCFNARKVTETGEEIQKLLFTYDYYGIDISREDKKLKFLCEEVLIYKVGWEACFRLYNKDVIKNNDLKFTDTKTVFAEDLDFYLRYLLHTGRIYFVCDILYYYRQVGSSLVHSYDERSIIPRLNNLTHNFYKAVTLNGDKIIKENFYRVYFGLINYHIQFKIDSLSFDEIKNEINEDRTCAKWLKRALKNKDVLCTGYKRRYWF